MIRNIELSLHPIHLIVQYYQCVDAARQDEIDTCLRNNLQNHFIAEIHLLTEVTYDFSGYSGHEKIRQTVIGERLTYERAFRYASDRDADGECIWILSNADIYFDETIRFVSSLNFNKFIFALTRHNLQPDGQAELMSSEFAHGSQDAWVFKTPLPLDKMFTAFNLGIPGCDHRIAYELVHAGYIVLNPSLKIIARHLDIARGIDIQTRSSHYSSLCNEESYQAGKAASPPYQYFLYPTDVLLPDAYALYRTSLSLYADNHELKTVKDGLEGEKAFLMNENARLYSDMARLHSDMELERAQFIRELHDIKRQLQMKDKRIADFEHSLSWRITAPLRRLGGILSVAATPIPPVDHGEGSYLDLSRLAELVAVRRTERPTILLFDFNLGGGSNLYSRSLIARLEKTGHKVILLEYRYGLKDFHLEYNTGSEIAEVKVTEFTSEWLCKLISCLQIQVMVVNQLVTWPDTPATLKTISSARIPYYVLQHDYFFVCPNWTLFDYKEKYCGIPDDPEVCASCLTSLKGLDIPLEQHTECRRIEVWRQSAGRFLDGADGVVCFSRVSRKILGRAYPGLERLAVIEHGIPEANLFPWQERSFAPQGDLTVAVVGGISVPKGSRLVSQLLEDSRVSEMLLRLVVLGNIVPRPNGTGAREKLIFHGEYERGELGSLLSGYDVSLVLIPSLCPETFCFTASEALLLGYPVVCCDIGAQADRVRACDAGWVVAEPYLEGVIAALQQICEQPGIVAEKSRKARDYRPVTVDAHFSEIVELLNRH